MEPAVALVDVFQHLAGRCRLNGVSLALEEGEWLLLVGPNGAGKSLLTRLILGLDAPSAGRVQVFGRDLAALGERALREHRRALMGAVLQGGSLLPDLTVVENLILPLRARPGSRQDMARAARLAMTQLQLDGLENHLPRSLSVGQRRRVELARALIHRPRLLVWDGLTDGLDQPGAREILSVLSEQQQTRKLTLITTDNRTSPAVTASNRIAVLDRGGLLFDGAPAELERSAEERLELRYVLKGRP